jgi:hypothetical protein
MTCGTLTLHLVSAWKHKFSSECIAAVHDQVFGAKSPTYATILQLDRKLRAYQVPPVLQIAGFGSTSTEPNLGPYPDTIPLILQRHLVLAIREISTHSSVHNFTIANGS